MLRTELKDERKRIIFTLEMLVWVSGLHLVTYRLFSHQDALTLYHRITRVRIQESMAVAFTSHYRGA